MAAEPITDVAPAAAQPGARLRVLIVEDNADDADLLQAYLADAGHGCAEVLRARSLAEGLALLRSSDVQLTLLDLDLPDSRGLRTLESLRAVATGPVVVVSGNGHPALVEESLKRSAYDVIPKHELDAATLGRILRLASLQQETGRALRSTEERFRALLENASEALVLLDAAGRISYASESVRRVLGYEADQAVGRISLEFVDAKDRGAVYSAFLRLHGVPGAKETLRVRYRHKDGGVRILESSAVNYLADPDIGAIVCNFRDVTAEVELEERFRATFEHAAVGLAHVDEEGRVLLANRRLCEMLGYGREELVGRTFRELSHAEDRNVISPQRERLRRGEMPSLSLRKRYLHKDGRVVWVQVTVAVMRDAAGAPLYDIAAFEEVSDAVRAESELRQSERRFRALIDNSSDGIVLVDVQGRIVYGSPATVRILGFDEGEALGVDVRTLVHPDNLDAFTRDLEEVRRVPGSRIAARTRLRHKDGGYRLLEGTWSNLLEEPGVCALVANFRDVTETARSLHALADAEERYRNLTESSPDAVLVHAFGEVLYVNPACVALLGAQRASEVIGRPIQTIVDPRDHGLLRDRLAHVAKGEHTQLLELRWQRVDRSVVEIEAAATPIKYAGRAAVQVLARDITARRLREQALQAAQSRSARLGRMYAALSAANEAILKTADARALYRQVCNLLVEHGGIKLAAVRLLDRATLWVESEAYAGSPATYLAKARVSVDAREPDARGPSAQALLEGRTLVNNDYLAEPALARWHAMAREARIGAMMSVPLRRGGEVIGLLSLYAAEAGWFDPELVGLAERMAANLSFALDAIDREERRRRAENLLEAEKRVLEMITLGRPQREVLQALVRAIEGQTEGALCAVLLLEGARLRVGAAPSLPAEYCRALEDNGVGPQAGANGAAAYRGERVIVTDCATDPLCAAFRGLDERHGLRACWAVPIKSRAGAVLGTVTGYYRDRRAPAPAELERVERAQNLAGIVLERELAEQALRASEERFRSLTELSSDWFWEQDVQYRFTAFSGGQGYAKWGGDQKANLGLRRWEIPGLVPLSSSWEAHRALLEARLPFRGFEYLRVAEDGTRRYVSASGEPLFAADGAFLGYRGTAADITERKSAEQRVRLEHEVARRLAAAEEETDGIVALMRALCESEGWDCGRYFRVDEDAGLLRIAETWGVDDPEVQRFLAASHGVTQAPGAGLAGEVWKTGEPLWLADVTADTRLSAYGRAISGGMRSAFIFPVTLQERILGVVSITGRVIREPDPALLQTLRAIGSQVGQFQRRKRAERATRESEARFRSLTELSSDWYWEQDAELRFVATGGSHDRRGGISAAQHTGLRRWELPGTEAVSCSWEEHQAALAARQPFRDLILRRTAADGRVYYVNVSGEPVLGEDGGFRGYRGVAQDVTQRYEAALALRESERRLSALFGNLPGIAYRCLNDPDWTSQFMSEGARALTGYGPEEYTSGRVKYGQLMHAEDRARVWQTVQDALAARAPFVVEYRLNAADGSEKQIWERGIGVYAEDGSVVALEGFIEDITDRRAAEAAMRESEERFRSLTQLSSDWYWEQDAQFRFTVVSGSGAAALSNGETARYLGRTRWESGDLEPYAGDWQAHRERLARHEPFHEEIFRRRFGDGRVGYMSVSGEPMFDAQGRFTGYRGVAKNVTERVRAEETIRDNEERFRRLSALSSDWYWEQGADFRFTRTSVDHSATGTLSLLQPVGKTRWELPVTPLGTTWEEHRETLQAHREFRDFEYYYTTAEGARRYVSASGYPVLDPQGRFVGYRGIARDISARKQVEQSVRVHAERQEAIARFGQYALGRRTVDELYGEAARTLRDGNVDAACALELMAGGERYMVRAAEGAGAERTLGLVATIAPDSLLPPTLRENASRVLDADFLAGRPDDQGREWLQGMQSGLYVPVRTENSPASVLSLYSRRALAFGGDDVRFAEAVAHVLSTALQRRRAEERLAHMAQFDALTGLPNRTLLQDRLALALLQSQRRNLNAGVLFVDLDRFKLINDTLGHHQGDALIRQVGQRLVDCVRPGDTVGRISGDEFAVVLADMARADDAALVAQKALAALAQAFDLGGNEAYVTASIGIAVYPADGADAATLLKHADMAMYRAKESARNSCCYFTAEMNRRSVAKVALNSDLRRALERSEFALYYQPKVDLATGALRGMEALLRWKHQTRGIVSPGEFIPALEDSGLILPVGEWVVEEACRQLQHWQAAGLEPVPVAVNLSPKQFRRRDLDGLIRASLARAGVSAEYLELEITESCLMEDPEDAVRLMRSLREAGLRISIDDFGTGYSSLSYLTRLPLSALKIDRSFVRDVQSSTEAASIVRAIIDMAQNLHLTVVAEGIETEGQAAFLRQHGCHQAQGYLFSRPVPAEEIGPRLAPRPRPRPRRKSRR